MGGWGFRSNFFQEAARVLRKHSPEYAELDLLAKAGGGRRRGRMENLQLR